VVSVNISATNLLDPEFPQHVHGVLARHDLEPQRLVLEITETAAMRDVKRCAAAIDEIRELGVAVSVDDFGAGFTSLAYLSTLAVSELKLDRSFIHGLTKENESRDLALIRSTISLAHALGLRVVAEGVEDQASLDLLISFGCDVVQGYLISKPKPAGELSLTHGVASPGRRASRSQQHARDAARPDLGGQWGYEPLPSRSNP
jgi:EAL domain-containing protein (putative c-di-GMP-specific phosphodiesterase class I)